MDYITLITDVRDDYEHLWLIITDYSQPQNTEDVWDFMSFATKYVDVLFQICTMLEMCIHRKLKITLLF